MVNKKNEDEAPKVLSREDQDKATEKAEKDAAKAEYKPETSHDTALIGHDRLHGRAAARAEEAGVVKPAYVDYEAALENYQSRSDVEPLAERRAREVGRSFDEASFRREIGGVDHTGVATTSLVTDSDQKVEDVDGEVGNEVQ